MEKTVVELFAGVGGFRCALNNVEYKDGKVTENGNWNFVWANQWEPATKSQDAFDCYAMRFGVEGTSNIDIFQVNKKKIPKHTLLVGGFPCQDYSVARTLSGSKGIEGKKGVLWWAIVDTIKAKKPPFLFLENVDRLLVSPASQRGRDFGIILRSLHDNGYAVQWRVINAGDYSEPQKRRRTYIFAYNKNTKYYKKMVGKPISDIIFKDGVFKEFEVEYEELDYNVINISKKYYKDLTEVSDKFEFEFMNAGVMSDGKIYTSKLKPVKNPLKTLRSIREKGAVDEKYMLSDDKLKTFEFLKGSKKIPRIKPNGDPYMYAEGSMPFPDNLDSPARTMLTSESGTSRMTHVIEDLKTKKLRILTPKECERINGFPDDWTNTGMSDKRRYFMMGNALVVGVVAKIGKEIEKIIEED